MKPEELRIGNWVNSAECGIAQVGSLDSRSRYIGLIDPMGGSHDGTTIDSVLGIELTEEWLVKFGFVKKVDHEQQDFEWGILSKANTRRGLGLYKPEEKENIWFVTFREDVGCGWADLNEIEYVHQLQNLHYALTGTELTIQG